MRPSALASILSIPLLFLFAATPATVVDSGVVLSTRQHASEESALALSFNSTRAFTYLEAQCAFGPRPPGSGNLTLCGNYIISILQAAGWPVQTQNWTFQDTALRNIIAGAQAAPQLVLLAHYDTRPYADRESNPANRTRHILGANDGASGVAVLLELAAVLPEAAHDTVTLLFVDAEDSGGLDGWPWIVGSTHYVASLTMAQRTGIRAAVLLDMIGDSDLQLKRETHSSVPLVDDVWQIAADLDYSSIFPNVAGWTLVDDHIPFLQAGIPAVDVIDFDYTYWHTLADTPDKCASTSLEAVGRVIEEYVSRQLETPTTYVLPPNVLAWWTGILVVAVVTAAGLLGFVLIRRRRHHN